MTRVHLSERQFHATLLPALRYRDALCVHNSENYVRSLCADYGDQIEIVSPPRSHDETWQATRMDQMMRLVNPQLRERAMVVVFWKSMPQTLLRRLHQVEVG